jgi:hypothetical protein
MRSAWSALVLLLCGLSPAAHAQQTLSIKAFYGTYTGSGIAENADSAYFGVTQRDFDVVIHPDGAGFSVAWTTVSYGGGDPKNPKMKRRQDTLVFVPGATPNTWRASETPDPLSGKPYAWARTEGSSLYIYVLAIASNGHYEMQRYERTLIGGGMELVFSDIADGAPARTVKGRLVKTAN